MWKKKMFFCYPVLFTIPKQIFKFIVVIYDVYTIFGNKLGSKWWFFIACGVSLLFRLFFSRTKLTTFWSFFVFFMTVWSIDFLTVSYLLSSIVFLFYLLRCCFFVFTYFRCPLALLLLFSHFAFVFLNESEQTSLQDS